jgi:hypothetical protein
VDMRSITTIPDTGQFEGKGVKWICTSDDGGLASFE